MGTHSHHLTLEDRCDLAHLHAAGLSLRHIAATLDCLPSPVACEMQRTRSRPQILRYTLRGSEWGRRMRCAATWVSTYLGMTV